jgi:putative restriction endonuclease
VERDDDLRASCFASLDVLCATFGEDVPYKDGLDRGFPFRGRRVPFLQIYKGIHRAAAQRGPAALSIQTSTNSPYDDGETDAGFRYAYRDGSIDQPDNAALRAAHLLQAPIVYFVSTGRPFTYTPLYPCYVVENDPLARNVVVSPGRMVGPLDEREPFAIENPIERKYVVREAKARVHQRRFRSRVLTAYRDSCAICRLKESRLLDAAHIVDDAQPLGEPVVSNGLSLCSIHHRAFDKDLVGISPDYDVHVSRRLLEDDDGPMLELLKTFHGQAIVLPSRPGWQPDREQLAQRFERFAAG